VRLPFDQNLAPRLTAVLADAFPGSRHVRDVGLTRAPDDEIWAYAKANDLAIVSKDSDFQQLSFLLGAPPKVISIRRGNCSVVETIELLNDNADLIRSFDADEQATLLILW